IPRSRITNEVNGKNTDHRCEKSRLVDERYSNGGKKMVLTQSPAIQRLSLSQHFLDRGFNYGFETSSKHTLDPKPSCSTRLWPTFLSRFASSIHKAG
ncbi:hypothetical protein K470DRAFT_219192, partial [Piedraia hortae CBS 480.64]